MQYESWAAVVGSDDFLDEFAVRGLRQNALNIVCDVLATCLTTILVFPFLTRVLGFRVLNLFEVTWAVVFVVEKGVGVDRPRRLSSLDVFSYLLGGPGVSSSVDDVSFFPVSMDAVVHWIFAEVLHKSRGTE